MKNYTLTHLKEKALNKAAAIAVAFAYGASQLTGMSAAASSANDLSTVTKPVIDLVKQIFNVIIPLVAAVGALFCISLGIKYSKAEEPQEREKAKQHLKNAIIGYVLIFVLVVMLRIGTDWFTGWMNRQS